MTNFLDSAFGWVGKIAEWVLLVIPRLVVVRSTHKAVKFKHGKSYVVQPGTRWYWPVTTEIDIEPVVEQTAELANQYLETSDSVQVGVGATVFYKIHDIEKAATLCFDVTDTLRFQAQGVIRRRVESTPASLLSQETLPTILAIELDEIMREYGVRITQITVTDRAKTTQLAHWGLGSNA